MKVRIKKLFSEAVIPKYANRGDAGLDLTAISVNHEYGFTEYGTGLSVEVPEGHVGLIFPRSSISNKDLILSNSVGVIDSNYRGEIKFRFKKITNEPTRSYSVGDRVGQLVILPIPQIELEEVINLSDTNRGVKGFGSSGN